MNKLLEDAKAAGFYVSDEGYIHNFDGLDKLNSKLAKFTTLQQPQWVSVKDRLPDDDNEFLVCVKDKFGNCEYSVAAYNKSSNLWDDGDRLVKYVTHWMPLPSPPISTEVT